ncbi:MAG: metalloregulator ArsR/SmtB family transcription factor [Aggregatilineales bacterium]
MTTIFEALVDPTRRQILDLIRQRPHMVGEIVDALQISQPLASKHLRVLREVGLVSVRQDAQRRWYELNAEPLLELEAWLKPYRDFIEDRYDRLETLLERIDAEENKPDDKT